MQLLLLNISFSVNSMHTMFWYKNQSLLYFSPLQQMKGIPRVRLFFDRKPVKIAFAGRRRRLEMPWHVNMLLFPYLSSPFYNAPFSVSPKKVTKMDAYNAHHREAFLLILNEGLELRIKRLQRKKDWTDITTPWKFPNLQVLQGSVTSCMKCHSTVTGW